jgi:hypothetical protein
MPIFFIGLKADNLLLKFNFHSKFDKIEALENATTLLSANKTFVFTKLNMNSAIRCKFTKFLLVCPGLGGVTS